MKYYDYCGWYTIMKRNDGTYSVTHRLASNASKVVRVGVYKTLAGAKIGLAKYCGGLPKQM